MEQVVRLPAEASSVPVARAFVAEVLDGHDPDEVWAAVLLASELVTNVVRHTDSEVRVTVAPGPPTRVEVHDGVAATVAFQEVIANAPARPAADAVSGRGIELVHRLASRIGLTNDPDGGKVVWFEIDP